jgi:hypothetical protein
MIDKKRQPAEYPDYKKAYMMNKYYNESNFSLPLSTDAGGLLTRQASVRKSIGSRKQGDRNIEA